MRTLRIADVMTSPVVTVRRDASFKEVVSLMHDHEVSGLPVVDDDGVTLVGIVTEADLLRAEIDEAELSERRRPRHFAWLLRPRDADRIRARADGVTAGELMTRPVITVAPDTTVAAAIRTLVHGGVKRLPVVDDRGRVVGIASRRDLLEPFLRDDPEIRREVEEDLVHRISWDGSPDVRVSVRDGEVTLSGRMHRRSEARILVDLTHRVGGVVHVQDELAYDVDDVEPADAEELMPHPTLPGRPPPSSM